MADLSDIVLRIRVDIVNNKAIAGLVNSLAAATSAVRTNSRATAVASDLATRSAQRVIDVEARRARAVTSQAAAEQRIVARTAAARQRDAASLTRNAAQIQRLEAAKQRTALQAQRAQERAAAASQRLAAAEARTVRLSEAAQQKLAAAKQRTAVAATKAAERSAAAAQRLSAAEARAAQQQIASAQRLAAAEKRALEQSAAAAARAATAESNAASKVARAQAKAAAAVELLAQKNKKLYSISSVLGQITGKVGAAFGKIVDPLSRVERKMDAVFRAGVHMQSMGRDLVGLGRRIVGALKGATDAWGDFEFNLNRAAGAMDIWDNKSQMYDKLKEAVMGMSRELRLVDPATAAKALYYWQSTTGESIDTTKKLNEAIAATTTALQVATMAEADQETVIKGAYSIMKQYKLSLKDVPQIMKDLYVASLRTSLEYGDLIQSFKFTGPVARMLGSKYKDVAKWLGIIGDLGQRGSMSGRGLAMMFTQVVRPTNKAKAAYNELFKAQLHVSNGYNRLVFPHGKFVGFEKLVTTLAKSMKGLTQQQKLNYLTTITGTQNSARIILPLVDAQMDALNKQKDIFKESKYSLAGSAKVFDKAWGLLSTSWKGSVGLLKQTVMPILLTLGSNIARVLTPILDDLSNALWEARPAFEEVAKTVSDAFTPALKTLGGMMKNALKWFKQNTTIVKAMAKWGAIATVISLVAGAFLLLAGTVSLLVANLVIVMVGALPMIALFLAIGVAVAAFATGVYRNVGGIQQSMAAFGKAVGRILRMIIGGTEDTQVTVEGLAGAFNDLTNWLTPVVARILDAITAALNRLTPQQVQIIKDLVKAFVGLKLLNGGLGILSSVINGLAGNIISMSKAMLGALPNIASFMKMFSPSSIGGAISGIKSLGSTVVLAIKAIGAAFAANPIGALITAIIAGIALLVAAYETNFMGFKDFVDGLVKWFTDNVMPGIQAAFTWLGQVIPPILQGIVDFINNVLIPAFSAVVTWLGETFAPVFDQLGATLAAAGEFFGVLGQKIGEVVTMITEWINSLGINVDLQFSGISITIEGVMNFITTVFNKFVEVAKGIIEPWLNALFAVVKQVFDSISKFISGVLQVIQGIFEVATGILSGDWGKVFEGLGHIVGGFVDTITAFWNLLWKLVGEAVNMGVTTLLNIFGAIFGTEEGSLYAKAKGFLKTITDFGGNIIGGLVTGIHDALSGAITSITGFIGSIVTAIKDFLGIKSPSTMFANVGDNIVAGLWKGISDAKDWIISKVTGFIKAVIPQPILDALGIKSPSRLMAEIGGHIVDGLAVGIERTDSALVAMNNMVADLTSVAGSVAGTIGGSFNQSITQDTTRTIELKVDVTSADGSVNSVDLNTLAGLITGSDMTRTLERMSTVD